MYLDFFPLKIKQAIINYEADKIYEIRIRINTSLLIFYNEDYVEIKNCICDKKDIEEIINNITEHSIYAFNNEIINGYITLKDGIRLGLAGKTVFYMGQVKTITDISSINVRLPHLVENCSLEILEKTDFLTFPQNILIFSPPFMGKTTIIKDIILQISKKTSYQTLIIDERGEFSNIHGQNIDVISFCTKKIGFEMGVRAMSPQIIILDEISNDDIAFLKIALNYGVKIIATCHANTIMDVYNKMENINFDFYVQLENSNKKGLIKNIFTKTEKVS